MNETAGRASVRPWMAGFCLLVMPILASADLQLRFSDGSMVAVGQGHVRMGDENEYTLMRSGGEEVFLISTDERTVVRVDPGSMAAMKEQMRAEMEKMLAAMPPEQRALIEQEMGDMMSTSALPQQQVVRSGERRRIGSYPCEVAEVRNEDGSLAETVCIATADDLGVDEAELETLADAMQRLADLMDFDLTSVAGLDFEEMGGLPIWSQEPDDSEAMTLVSVSTDDVPASLFDIPTGYEERSMAEDMME